MRRPASRVVVAAVLLSFAADRAGAQSLQEVQFLDPEGASFHGLGAALSVSGDTAAIGVPGAGEVHVYVRSGTQWSLQDELALPSGPSVGFGNSVALEDDLLVVGAPFESVSGAFWAGAAYVFVRSGGTWSEPTKLVAAVPQEYDRLGGAVALSGETALLGGSQAHGFNPPQSGAGLAYVFVRHGAAWNQQAKLTGAGLAGGSAFGAAVALDGDTALVGAPTGDAAGPGVVGAAFVFTRAGNGWTQQAELHAAGQASDDVFGSSVALDGDTAAVGAPIDTHGDVYAAGTVTVFTRAAGTWTQQATLVATDPVSPHGPHVGSALDLEGDVCVAGASHDTHSGGEWAGSAFVFERSGTSWSEQAKLTASDAANQDHFGTTVSLSGDTVLVGASFYDTAAATSAGSAFGFRVLTTAFGTWADLGQALAGTAGEPRLVGWGPLLAGGKVHLTLTWARASSLATVVVGLSALQAPFKGGVLVPESDLLIAGLFSDATGQLELPAAWPAGLPSGLETWYQIWIVDPLAPQGLAASNGVRSTTP